jgi:hypothetical protein
MALSHKAEGQPHSKKKSVTKPSDPNGATQYYRVAGLGSAKGDSINKFPHPIAIFQLLDTEHTRIVVRFPELGMLGTNEDTVSHPTFKTRDTLLGYKSSEPFYMLTFPKTKYFVFVDVWSRSSNPNAHPALLDSRPLEYDMNVEAYKTAHINYVHDPTAGMGSPTLRRRFKPTLLPFSVETNPGWASTESLDSSATYALMFRDPRHTEKLAMSLTMHPAIVGVVDSTMWQSFKSKAEMSFGEKGIATSSIGDFQVADSATRHIIKGGYEFISKNSDSTLDYVAAFLTPRAILLMLAPLDEANQQLQFIYFQAIARSLKLE